MSIGTTTMPIPMPASKTSNIALPEVSVADHRLKSRNATVRLAIPATTTVRYPTRSTSRALSTDITTQPRTNGVSTRPAPVALAPVTDGRNSGTNGSAPNIAMPARNRVTTAARTIRFLNNLSGTIGSTARPSTTTNATSTSTPMTSRPTTSTRDQDPTRPASTMPIRSAETPAPKSPTPVPSTTGRRAGLAVTVNAAAISAIATAPNGRLM